MEKEMVNSLLNKIGKAFFVKYLIDTIENNVNFTEISKKEDISVSSCYTRISNIKRIIRENKTNTALEVCIDSKRFSKIYLKKIQELLEYINKLQYNQEKHIENKHNSEVDLNKINNKKIVGFHIKEIPLGFNIMKQPSIEYSLNFQGESFKAIGSFGITSSIHYYDNEIQIAAVIVWIIVNNFYNKLLKNSSIYKVEKWLDLGFIDAKFEFDDGSTHSFNMDIKENGEIFNEIITYLNQAL
jgi:hypothetical protein